MNRYDIGNSVAMAIEYVDDNGDPLTPSAVTYSVLDENDNVIVSDIAVTGPYTSPQTITIPGSYNAAVGGRRVQFEITSSVGTSFLDIIYQVRNSTQRLIPMIVAALPENQTAISPSLDQSFVNSSYSSTCNSFQTYLQAMLTANDMVNISSFIAADEDACIGALMEAYYRLTRFGYLIKWPEYVDTQNIYLQDIHARITPQMWPVMTPYLFAAYPVTFQKALAKAQIIEANSVLSPDPIRAKIRAGVYAETIGESKIMFRPGIRPLDLGISRETLEAVRQYLDYRFTLTRAP